MIIDSSALIAILCQEQESEFFLDRIMESPVRRMSAASVLEVGMVLLSRFGEAGEQMMKSFLYRANIEIVSVSEDQSWVALQAFRRFGKGRHPARLNYGDCFAYGLSKQMAQPLLCKGNDFSQTDCEVIMESFSRLA